MFSLSPKQQWLIGAILLFALVLTRSHIFHHIQDASWAIFFLVGFYLRSYLGYPVFWLAAFAIDLVVIDSKGGESFCFTPAYAMTIVSYAMLWGAGRWFAQHYQQDWRGMARFVAAAVVGTTLCFLISNAGFYWLSGRFPDMNMVEYAQRVAKYLPMYLQTTLFYLGIATLVHIAVLQAANLKGKHAA